MSTQPVRANPAVGSNPSRPLPIPKTAPKPPGSLPVNPLVLEQQRQILELQKQVLELQIQQQKGTASVIEAKTPLLKMQLDDLNRREASVRYSIEQCQRRIQSYQLSNVSHRFPKGWAHGENGQGGYLIDGGRMEMAVQARQDFTNLEIHQKELNEILARKKTLEVQIQQLLNTAS